MRVYGAAALLLACSATASIAQQSGQDSPLPESMRIEQSVTQQNMNASQSPAENGSAARGSSATSGATTGSSTGVEMNRIDPSAPSPQRLQIDDGRSAAVRQNPDANSLHPGAAGTSYNTILRGAPSNSGVNTGASPGTSGIGGGLSGSSSGGLGGGGAGGAAGGGSAGGR